MGDWPVPCAKTSYDQIALGVPSSPAALRLAQILGDMRFTTHRAW
jgi:hypothetical protein